MANGAKSIMRRSETAATTASNFNRAETPDQKSLPNRATLPNSKPSWRAQHFPAHNSTWLSKTHRCEEHDQRILSANMVQFRPSAATPKKARLLVISSKRIKLSARCQ